MRGWLLAGVVVIAGCTESPVSPWPPPAAREPPPNPPSFASVAIEAPLVVLRPDAIPGQFWVAVRFLLKETGGNSGATIQSIFVRNGRTGSGEQISGLCTEGLRIPAGGVLDVFYTDEGYRWLSYCAPANVALIGSPILEFPVRVSVVFLDDEGRMGRVDATAVWK